MNPECLNTYDEFLLGVLTYRLLLDCSMLEVLYMLTPDFCTYLLLVFDLILVPTFVTFLQDIDSPYEVSIEPVLSINDKNFHLVPDRFLINNS